MSDVARHPLQCGNCNRYHGDATQTYCEACKRLVMRADALAREVEALKHERDEHRGTAMALERQLAEAQAIQRQWHADANRLGKELAEAQQRIATLEAEKHYSATIDAETELLPRLQQAEARLAELAKPCILDGCQFEGMREKNALAERVELKQRLAEVVSGKCLKCNMGPLRESCAYPEACEHPGRELAKALNRALLDKAGVVAALEEIKSRAYCQADKVAVLVLMDWIRERCDKALAATKGRT